MQLLKIYLLHLYSMFWNKLKPPLTIHMLRKHPMLSRNVSCPWKELLSLHKHEHNHMIILLYNRLYLHWNVSTLLVNISKYAKVCLYTQLWTNLLLPFHGKEELTIFSKIFEKCQCNLYTLFLKNRPYFCAINRIFWIKPHGQKWWSTF